MNDIVIYGAGGFAREVLALLRDVNREREQWNVLGFLDDRTPAGTVVDGLEVLGNAAWLEARAGRVHAVVGVGSPAVKRRLAERLRPLAAGFPTLVHPGVVRTEFVRLEEGVVVTAGNILTTQVEVGRFAMLNLACTVGHDARIGAYATLSPGVNVSGFVNVGEGCDVGTGSALIQGVSIGPWSVVGAGGVVAGDLPANCTAVGVPARAIKQRPDGWHLA
jgi:sugar O-acyltransferase (sialic acid O-acetyltransferase NeuD family)